MKSTYTTSWYGENFYIKSCHMKVGNLALQEIIFLTNNLDKLRHLEKCPGVADFNPWIATQKEAEGTETRISHPRALTEVGHVPGRHGVICRTHRCQCVIPHGSQTTTTAKG